MITEVKHDEDKQKFYIEHDGKESQLEYKLRGTDVIDFTSTFVPPEYRNKGFAERMAVKALNYARVNNLKVIPTCDFMREYINRNEQYSDLLK